MSILDIPDLDGAYLVKYAMDRLNMNQQELANELGCDRTAVTHWLRRKEGHQLSAPYRKQIISLMLHRQAALMARKVATGAHDYYSLRCVDAALLVNEQWLRHVEGCSRCMARLLYDAGKVTPI